MTSSFIFRSRIVLFFVLVFSLILGAKLFLVQIVHGGAYSESADRQYATPAGDIYERGSIFFESKDGQLISAASQTFGFKLALDPGKITDRESVYKKLSEIIAIDYGDFMAKASKVEDPYEEVANRLSKEEADAVSLLKTRGLNIFKEKWRFYPGGSLASHALGLVGYQGVELGGRYGLERFYEKELNRNNKNPYVNFFAEIFANLNKTLFKDEVSEGDIVTTIEPEVQIFLEKRLEEVKERYQADSIGGIIMNPSDGSIYAMGAKPDFNPNDFSQIEKSSIFGNPLAR